MKVNDWASATFIGPPSFEYNETVSIKLKKKYSSMYYVSKQKHEQTWEHVLKLLAIILVHVFHPTNYAIES